MGSSAKRGLPDRIPAEGASCMYDLPMRNAVSNGRDTPFAVELTHNGGTGARPGKDGLSATAFPSGVYGSQVEVTIQLTTPDDLRNVQVVDLLAAGLEALDFAAAEPADPWAFGWWARAAFPVRCRLLEPSAFLACTSALCCTSASQLALDPRAAAYSSGVISSTARASVSDPSRHSNSTAEA